ncbi:MAG: hypothetical protein IPI35_05525 [Deltaproteobacteria bacterium]|nr:hypothetical protein [Deltaproteobacteria bacterium]
MQGTARRLVHGLFALLISTALMAPSTAESTSRELPTRAQVYVSAPDGEATAEPAAPSFFTAEHELGGRRAPPDSRQPRLRRGLPPRRR